MQGLALDERRILRVGVIRVVTRGAVEFEPPDVRGEDLLVALAAELLADEILQFLADDRTLGCPENQARADGLVDMEKLQLASEFAVIALARLFLHDAPFLELLGGRKGDSVNALKLRILLVALVVGAGHRGESEGPDLPGRLDVGTGTKVGERAVAVEADFLAFGNAFEDIELVTAGNSSPAQRGELARTAQLHGVRARNNGAFEFLVFGHDLGHLGFDLGKVLRRNAVR